jgi:basic membrane protein A
VGCGKKEEAAARPPQPAAAPAAAPAKPEPLKIAFAYVGPVGDGGWTFAHDNGRKAVEKEFGDKVVTSFVEKVPEAADAERVFRDMVGQGNKLIFGTTFGYMEPMLKVAADTPGRQVRACHRLQDGREHAHLRQPHLRGRLHGRRDRRQDDQDQHAGRGRLDPHPRGHPQHQQLHAGRAERQPEGQDQGGVGQRVVQPAQGDRGRHLLINGGADVLLQNTDSAAVLQTAAEQGQARLRLGQRHERLRPQGAPGSAVINWGPYYIKATRDALEGKWATAKSWWGVKEGAIDIVSIADNVPAEIKAKVEKIKAGLKDGSFVIWKGPIVGQDGKEVLAKDAVADDKFLGGGKVNFYVKGVEGKVPTNFLPAPPDRGPFHFEEQ